MVFRIRASFRRDALRFSETLLDEFHVALRRFTPGSRFLLKRVKYIYRRLELDRIHGPKSVAPIILHDLDNSGAAESAKSLCVAMLAALLRDVQSIAHEILYRLRKFAQILQARSHPNYRF